VRTSFRYGDGVLAKRGTQIPPLTGGKFMIAVSVPLLAGWIVAAVLSSTDLFTGPFFWAFAYLLIVGLGLFVWGEMSPARSRFQRHIRSGSSWTLALEELAFVVASFLLFSAFVGR
jgi:hypothetical protein